MRHSELWRVGYTTDEAGADDDAFYSVCVVADSWDDIDRWIAAFIYKRDIDILSVKYDGPVLIPS